MSRITRILALAVAVLLGALYLQHKRTVRISNERETYRQNTEALLSDMQRLQIDSTTMAVDVNALRLTENEYKRLRAEDLSQIEKMGVHLKNLEAAARHEMKVNVTIRAPVMDSVVFRDTLPITVKVVKMQTPYIFLNGIIENNELIGDIHLPITLRQAVWIEYKRRWLLWKKVVAVHQTISSDNPHVEITYSEYIQVQK